MGTVVERLASAPGLEPVPVIRLHIVLVGLAWRRPLPKIPIERCRDRRFLAHPDGLADVAVPGLCVIGAADEAIADFVDDLDGMRRRALLRPHLHMLAIFPLRFNQKRALG